MSVLGFPVACPIMQFAEAQFDVQRRQSAGLNGAGRDVVIDRGIPQWKATIKTRPLFDSEVGQMRAFRKMLRGGARFFTMWDPERQYPLAYMPKGPPAMTRATIGGTFDGHCSLTTIGYSLVPGSSGRDQLLFGPPYALPVGLTLNNGDYIEARQGVNLLGVSDFSSGQAETNASLAANVATAPDATTTAALFTRTATGAAKTVGALGGIVCQGIFYRLSVWLALGSMTGSINIQILDGAGVVQAQATVAPTTTWARFELTGQMPPTATTGLGMAIAPVLAGSAGQTLYLWKALLTEIDKETISLHQVLDPSPLVATSVGSITAWIEPELPASFTTDALLNVYQARGKFRLVDWQLPVLASGRARPGQATFTAMSTLL
jgi:hypothetical protein